MPFEILYVDYGACFVYVGVACVYRRGCGSFTDSLPHLFLFIVVLNDIYTDACVCNISRFSIRASRSKSAAVLVITSLRTVMCSPV